MKNRLLYFKLFHDTVNDLLASGLDRADAFTYLYLYTQASINQRNRGYVPSISHANLAYSLNITEKQLQKSIDCLVKLDYITVTDQGIKIIDFQYEQYDLNTKRNNNAYNDYQKKHPTLPFKVFKEAYERNEQKHHDAIEQSKNVTCDNLEPKEYAKVHGVKRYDE